MDNFKIKNFEFLVCLNKIDRIKELEVYKFIEKLIYGEMSQSKIDLFKEILKKLKVDKFILEIKKYPQFKNTNKDLKIKRKNIKESMLENYVIKNKMSYEFLKELNLKILLKIIPNKNIIVNNGDIIDIIL